MFERFLLTSAGAAIFSSCLYTPRAMFRILSVTCLLTRKALRLIISKGDYQNTIETGGDCLMERWAHFVG